MPEKYRRYFLKEREAKALIREASERFGLDLEQFFKRKVDLEVVETDFAEIFLLNDKPILAKKEKSIYPTLIFNEYLTIAPKAVVDIGAVPYVCKGANVMAPGIRRYEGEFKKGALVFVVDEKHGKALGVGEALYDSEEARKVKQGIVIRNVHFVGDKTWNFIREFTTKSQ
jgi:PUA domain protein